MGILPEVLLSGVMVGSVYSLIALGFVLIYKASGVFNLAQGEFLLFGGCIGWTCAAALGLNFWLSMVLTVCACAVLGLLVERLVLHPLIGEPLLAVIMVTVALAMVLKGILTGIWWAAPYGYPRVDLFEWSVLKKFLGTGISTQFLMASIISGALIVIFLLFFKYTKLGLGMRAVAEDHRVAQSLGIKVGGIFTVTWIIAAVVAGIGGVLLGQVLTVSPELARLGWIVLPVALLGGVDSIGGCIVGGITIGVAENIAAVYLDPFLPHSGGLRIIIPYLIMLVVLIIRPYGLFGLERIERV